MPVWPILNAWDKCSEHTANVPTYTSALSTEPVKPKDSLPDLSAEDGRQVVFVYRERMEVSQTRKELVFLYLLISCVA